MTCVPSGLISLWIATGSSRTSKCPSVDSQWDRIPFRHPLLSPSTWSNRLCNAQHVSLVSSAAAVLCNLFPFSKILLRPRHGLQTTHRLIPSEMEFHSAIHCSVRQCQVIDYAMLSTWASCHRLQQCCVILSLSSKSPNDPVTDLKLPTGWFPVRWNSIPPSIAQSVNVKS